MTKYGRSPWTDRLPRSRVPSYPRLKGRHEIDVVIIGGGLTGCATAYAFAAAGIKVALVEASQIGRGASSLSSGWVSDDPGASFVAGAANARPSRRAPCLAGVAARRARLHCARSAASTSNASSSRSASLVAAITPDQALQSEA